MNKFLKSILVFISLLLLPSISAAQDPYFKPYVGGGLGGFVISNGLGENWVFGGYASMGAEVLPFLALEGRVGGAADASNVSSTFGIDYFVAGYAKPQFKIEEAKINIYGLLGLSSVKSWSQLTGATKLSKSIRSFSYGGGIEYVATDNLMLGVEGVILDGEDRSGTTATWNGNYAGSVVGTVRMTF